MSDALFVEHLETPVGLLRIVTDRDEVLRATDWEPDRVEHAVGAVLRARGAASRPAAALRRYFAGELDAIDGLAAFASGTEFQRAVWAALRDIPTGRTESYGALAARIGRPRAVRAVGAANGRNPIAIVVPCHRVIGADRSLTGYGAGLPRKRWLLRHEGIALADEAQAALAL